MNKPQPIQVILFDRGETLVHFGETDYEAGQKVILSSVRSINALNRTKRCAGSITLPQNTFRRNQKFNH